MTKLQKNVRGNTVLTGDSPADQLTRWSIMVRRHADALRRAADAAELVTVMWAWITPEQREALLQDDQMAYLIRHIISPAYGL